MAMITYHKQGWWMQGKYIVEAHVKFDETQNWSKYTKVIDGLSTTWYKDEVKISDDDCLILLLKYGDFLNLT